MTGINSITSGSAVRNLFSRTAVQAPAITPQASAGDGRDKIETFESFTVAVSGYKQSDVEIQTIDGTIRLRFWGGDDALEMVVYQGRTATIRFDDGASITIDGTAKPQAKTYRTATSGEQWEGGVHWSDDGASQAVKAENSFYKPAA